jgi:hypothetical protein
MDNYDFWNEYPDIETTLLEILDITVDDDDAEWMIGDAKATTKWGDVEGKPFVRASITHPAFSISFSNLFEEDEYNVKLELPDSGNMFDSFEGDTVAFLEWLEANVESPILKAAMVSAKAEYQAA